MCLFHHQAFNSVLNTQPIISDSYHQRARYVEQLELDLAAANKHIRSLREELQQHQSSVFKLQADTLGQSVCDISVLHCLFICLGSPDCSIYVLWILQEVDRGCFKCWIILQVQSFEICTAQLKSGCCVFYSVVCVYMYTTHTNQWYKEEDDMTSYFC